MGCCDSRSAQEKKVDADVQEDQRKNSKIYKLLFLGSGDSGKSTIFKQLRKIHGEGYNDVYRRSFIPPIHNQVLAEMQHAITLIEFLHTENPEKYMDAQISNTDEAKQNVQIVSNAARLSPVVAVAIDYLWRNEPVIKTVYSLRSTLLLADSTQFFWNEISRIARADYVPTDEDIVLVRNPTTGLYQQTIEIEGYLFCIVDVGGQRTERRKWMHQFENVTSVIFIASLSCFDAVLYEDDSVNAMKEQLTLFNNICNDKYFTKTAMILLLNKRDIFQTKILADPENINIRNVFPDFTGDCTNYQECARYIKKQFEALNNNRHRVIFVHFCCATDTGNVEKIFNDIQHIVVTASLSEAGLILQ